MHDAASRWLARRQGAVQPEAEREFRDWLDAAPSHRLAYEEAQRTWRESLALAGTAIGRERQLSRAPFLMRRSTHIGAASLAATMVLGVVTIGLVRQGNPFALITPAEAASYRTAVGEIRTFALPDGSRMTLDTASLARVRFVDERRQVLVERGRIRFEVASGDKRAFVVLVPGGEARLQSGRVDVSLAAGTADIAAFEGSVVLRDAKGRQTPRSLAAGEQSSIDAGAKPRPVSTAQSQWVSGMLVLDATALGDAVAAINRYNTVQVRLAAPELARLAMTGGFRARDPQGFARAVAAAFDLAVSHPDASTILLSPRS